LRVSMEADLYPANKPELAELVDGSIGEGSYFHEQFGYYAQGVSPETAILPAGWEHRLVAIKNANTGGVEGLCLEVHDLAIAKCVAGREKDLAFTRELARHRIVKRATLLIRLADTRLDPQVRKAVTARIQRAFAVAPQRASKSRSTVGR
ncbi:MAG: DUF6036 family nucleotidyltransferase, partial [Burkholderiales bacterium]